MGSSKGGGGSATPQINPYDMAKNQSQQNLLTAIGQQAMNNTDQITPFGTLKYHRTGSVDLGNGQSVPTYLAQTTLSPEQEKLYSTQTSLNQSFMDLGNEYVGRIRDATATPFNYEGLPSAPIYDEQFRQRMKDSIVARNQPQMERDRAAVEQMLANRGVGIQDPGYKSALDQYQRGVNDFMLGADLQSGQEAKNSFDLAATTRDRAIAERQALRAQPINEVAALIGQSGGVQQPNFVNTPQTQIANTDTYAPFAMQMQQANAQQQMQMQQQNALMGGLFGLGSAGVMAFGMGGKGRG
jgi:hypothetical protein